MTDLRHTQGMPDTGERREIKRFVNAKEAETVEEAAKLTSKTKQGTAKAVQENLARKPRETEAQRDQKASERMVDEGDPNQTPMEKGKTPVKR